MFEGNLALVERSDSRHCLNFRFSEETKNRDQKRLPTRFGHARRHLAVVLAGKLPEPEQPSVGAPVPTPIGPHLRGFLDALADAVASAVLREIGKGKARARELEKQS